MRRALIAVVGGLIVAALTACSISVRGVPSADATAATSSAPSSSSAAHPSLPGGAQPSCLVADNCGGDTPNTTPAGLVCSPLAAARAAFDRTAAARFPGRSVPRSGTEATWSPIGDLVVEVVDDCGVQVMVDVADQYPDPLYTWLAQTAVSALGEIAALPDGLRCADLQTLGLGPKQAVDYWFLWGRPPLMDADSNGIPCETVWPDVARYLPNY